MQTKKALKFFSIFEYEKEQDYLRNMHKSGWKFVCISGFCVYHFEKCEPEDVIYQLDYNQEGIAHKDQYIKMFEDCGWEYLQDYVGYSYFRKPAAQMAGSEEIFCDDDSRLQMMSRVFKGRVLPAFAIFFCVIIPNFLMSMDGQNYAATAIFGLLTGIYLGCFGLFAYQYMSLKKRR